MTQIVQNVTKSSIFEAEWPTAYGEKVWNVFSYIVFLIWLKTMFIVSKSFAT